MADSTLKQLLDIYASGRMAPGDAKAFEQAFPSETANARLERRWGGRTEAELAAELTKAAASRAYTDRLFATGREATIEEPLMGPGEFIGMGASAGRAAARGAVGVGEKIATALHRGGGLAATIQAAGMAGETVRDEAIAAGLAVGDQPSLSQAGAELLGGIGGTIVGMRGGMAGRILGAGAGTMGGGYLTGRSAVAAFIDGLQAASFEAAATAISPTAREIVVRRLPPSEVEVLKLPSATGQTAKDLILINRVKQRELVSLYDRFEVVKADISGQMQAAKAEVSAKYHGIAEAVPMMDITAVEHHARELQIPLRGMLQNVIRGTETTITPAETQRQLSRSDMSLVERLTPQFGGDVEAAMNYVVTHGGARPKPTSISPSVTNEVDFTRLSFDDALKLHSELWRHSQMKRAADPIRAAAFTELEQDLFQRLASAARDAGVYEQWRAARTWYKDEYLGRYGSLMLHDLVAKTSAELWAPDLLHFSVDDAKELFRSLNGLDETMVQRPSDVAKEASAGLVSYIIQQSADVSDWKQSFIRGETLVRLVSTMNETARDLLLGGGDPQLGRQIGDGLLDVGRALMSSKARGTMTVALAGEAAMMGGIAGTGGAGLSLGALEGLNEATMLGRLFMYRPKMLAAMTQAILSSKEESRRQFGPSLFSETLGLLRITSTQAVSQAVSQIEGSESLKIAAERKQEEILRALLRSQAMSVDDKIEAAQQQHERRMKVLNPFQDQPDPGL